MHLNRLGCGLARAAAQVAALNALLFSSPHPYESVHR